MLRKTASRAFGAGDKPVNRSVPNAKHETDGGEALLYLFDQLRKRLLEEVSATPEGSRLLSVSDVRSLPQGVEFQLAGPVYSFRFLNTMEGSVLVWIRSADAPLAVREILSVQPQWGVYRPTWRPLPEGLRDGRGLAADSSMVRFTDAAELAMFYVRRASGNEVDAGCLGVATDGPIDN